MPPAKEIHALEEFQEEKRKEKKNMEEEKEKNEEEEKGSGCYRLLWVCFSGTAEGGPGLLG